MLARVRLGFTLLALLLAVPLSLLLAYTFRSLANEREARHLAVASRVFDEAERSLASFLREEERRSPEEYESALRSPETSPMLADGRSFVLGYFVADPSGSVSGLGSTPRPGTWREVEAALEPTGARQVETLRAPAPKKKVVAPTSERLDSYAVLEQLNRAMKQQRPEPPNLEEQKRRQLKPSPRAEPSSAAATPAEGAAADGRLEPSAPKPKSIPPERSTDARRSPQRQRSVQRSIDGLASRSAGPELNELSSSEAEEGDSARPPEPRLEERDAGRRAEVFAAALSDEVSDTALDGEAERELEWELDGRAQFSVTPTVDGRYVFYRTARSSSSGRRTMGFLLSPDLLGEWIDREVVSESGLDDYLSLRFSSVGSGGREPGNGRVTSRGYEYGHRFQPPFDALEAQLLVARLPDGAATYSIYAMSALVLIVATVGLFAMYQRVATAIHFSERRSNFAAAVSHELKTPLTSIRMYAEMLRDGMVPDSERQREYLSVITSESERLTRLIQNVLEFSRLERRQPRSAPQPAALEPVLTRSLEVLTPHARAQDCAIEVESSPDLPMVLLEPDALEQILFNLVDNALKYSAGARDRQIEVSARQVQDRVELRVRDHGPGVPSDHLARIFEPFYRGEHELTRTTQGTGIGLALVAALAERTHARVSGRNHPDGGFEVCLSLAVG